MLLATVLGLDAKTWEAEDIPMVHLTDARRYVCDPDEILSQAERDSIDSYLLRLDKQCGVESVFVIVKRVSNGDTFRFAQDLGNRQGVGSKKTNRGLVVVVAVEDRRYFIAPGEGLEKDLTDIECDDIGRACIVTNMKRGEPGQAVLATAQAVYKKLKTGTTGIQENTDEDAGAGLAIVLFTVICIVVVLVILNRRDNRGKGGGGGGGSRRSGGPFIIWATRATPTTPEADGAEDSPAAASEAAVSVEVVLAEAGKPSAGPAPTGSQSPPRLRRQQQNYNQKTISIWNQRS